MSRVDALNQLGRQSDTLSRLNKATAQARQAVNRIYKKTDRSGLDSAISNWQTAKGKLQQAYDTSTRFSSQQGITRLPIPDELTQQ